jgi:hypothetical protein
MTKRMAGWCLLAGVCCLTPGCGGLFGGRTSETSPEKPDAWADETHREWKKVYTTVIVEGTKQRTHQGYVCHRFRLRDRNGTHFVFNREHEQRGFVLPVGKAFVFEKTRDGETVSREIAYAGVDRGILAILGVKGIVEYEPVSETDLPRGKLEPIPPR